jgi:amidase
MSTWVSRFDAGSGPGVRLAVKDCIDLAGLPTVVGCEPIAALAGPAAADADVVAAARKAGAAIVGKTNLTELCWTASGVNSWSGTPVNPVDPARVPGGSSSGSAVAVAAGEAEVALGTDTGGSVRIPAACCGVVGLKTTWGRISLRGVYPLAPSLDTVGPLGADVAAVELGMRLIDPGFDASAASGAPGVAVGRIRPGVDVDPAVDAAVDRALAAAGLAAGDVAGPDLAAIDRVAGVIIDGEAYRANEYLLPHLDRLSRHSRDGMASGATITDADLAAAREALGPIRAWFAERFEDYPFLAMPTLVGAPPLIGGPRIPLTVLTMPVNLAGLPALALPVPDGPAGLPASLQLIGPPGSEERLIALGRLVEAALR